MKISVFSHLQRRILCQSICTAILVIQSVSAKEPADSREGLRPSPHDIWQQIHSSWKRGDRFLGNTYTAVVSRVQATDSRYSHISFDQIRGPLTEGVIERAGSLLIPEMFAFGNEVVNDDGKPVPNPLPIVHPVVKPLQWDGQVGPVPVAVGLPVTISLSRDGRVEKFEFRLSYEHDPVVAVRKRDDAQWELLVCTNERPPRFLYLFPRLTDFTSSEVVWTQKYGLLIGSFQSEYGGAPESELEKPGSSKGIPVANVSGMFIKPGRDNWSFLKPLKAKWVQQYGGLKWQRAVIPESQFSGQ